jgi:hypothetical protein
MPFRSLKIISGGQTGADRSALDWAIRRRIPHGGWCPHGRGAEDGEIARIYHLKETPSHGYLQRTEWNVRDSCGTVIFTVSATLSGGSLATMKFAEKHKKPWIHLHLHEKDVCHGNRLLMFLRSHHIRVLNVAGSGALKEPEIHWFVVDTLDRAFHLVHSRKS